METSSPSSSPESSVQRTIFFALILSYCGDSALSDGKTLTAEPNPIVQIGNYPRPPSILEGPTTLLNS